jgi:hypothetical protein
MALPKIYMGSNLYLDSSVITTAIGSELGSATSFQDIVDDLVYDKQRLVDILNSKDIECDINYSFNTLIEFVNNIT